MPKEERHLITTALERTWPKEKTSVLFLGEWCKKYNRRNEWKKYDHITSYYHWNNRTKLHEDFNYITNLYEKVLGELTIKLNEIHKVSYSKKYWRILLGRWLSLFIQTVYDRWASIKYVQKNYKIKNTYILKYEPNYLIPKDTFQFEFLVMDDFWNDKIYGELIQSNTDIPFDFINYNNKIEVKKKNLLNFNFSFKKILKKLFFYLSRCFKKKNDIFFLRTYLKDIDSILVQLKLKQSPIIWQQVNYEVSNKIIDEYRNWTLESNPNDQFSQILSKILPKNMPISFLEGYKDLNVFCSNLPWPKYPKAIFTSVSYATDSVFNFWTANKIEGGSKLIIGQHGGDHLINKISSEFDHKYEICDHYLSWGYKNKKYDKITPLGNFMLKKELNYKPQNKASLILNSYPRYSYHLSNQPISPQILNYFDNQYEFLSKLTKDVINNLKLRVYIQEHGWNFVDRIKNKFPNIYIEKEGKAIINILKNSKLIICSSNGTTYLESLFFNIPTIIFWDMKNCEINKDAEPFFDKLKKVGIFHDNPELAAKKTNEVWNDVSKWWNDKKTQEAVHEFCDFYVLHNKEIVNSLVSFFKKKIIIN